MLRSTRRIYSLKYLASPSVRFTKSVHKEAALFEFEHGRPLVTMSQNRAFHHDIPRRAGMVDEKTIADEDMVKSVKSMLSDAFRHKNSDIIMQQYERSLRHGIELSQGDCKLILNYYSQSLKSPIFNMDSAVDLYEKIRANNSLNLQVYKNMLTICRHQNNHRLAMEVNKDFESMFKHSERSLRLLISTLADTNAVSSAMVFYKRYRSYLADNSALNANNAAAFEAASAAFEASSMAAAVDNHGEENEDNSCDHTVVTPSPVIPPRRPAQLHSNWKPLAGAAHLDLVKMLIQNDQRMQAIETLYDFAEDNDRYSDKLRREGASEGGAVCSPAEEGVVEEGVVEEGVVEEEVGEEGVGEEGVVEEGAEAATALPPSFITSILMVRHPEHHSLGWELMRLLEDGLVRYDSALVKLLLTWLVEACEYMQQCPGEETLTGRLAHIPRGLVRRCFQLAGALGNPEISDLTKELCVMMDITLEREEYSQLFISYCRGQDVESTIETLLVAEASDINLFSHDPSVVSLEGSSSRQVVRPSNVHLLGPRFLQTSISKMLRKLDESDRLYYALAELVQADMQPPVSALNALIIAQGNVNLLDRAFAVMQEFETVFNASPNAHTYHALLGAIASSHSPRIENMFHILSDMDDAGFPPDAGCFSLLLETMMKCDDLEGATGILEHLRSTAIVLPSDDSGAGDDADANGSETEIRNLTLWPYLRTLRQLAIFYTKRGDVQQCDLVLQMIREKSGTKILPGFFMKRMELLEQKGAFDNEY